MNKVKRVHIFTLLSKNNSSPTTELVYETPFELLIAVILSAQATDISVNKVTKKLFTIANTPEKILFLGLKKLKNNIKTIGLYNNKAKNLIAAAKRVRDVYGFEVPDTMEELLTIPGVARKTANVVLGNYFDVPGLVVDTHVTRISNLLKFSKSTNAVIIEKKLNKIVSVKDWVIFTHLIIDHGRAVCIANRPKCNVCSISKYCPSSN